MKRREQVSWREFFPMGKVYAWVRKQAAVTFACVAPALLLSELCVVRPCKVFLVGEGLGKT